MNVKCMSVNQINNEIKKCKISKKCIDIIYKKVV